MKDVVMRFATVILTGAVFLSGCGMEYRTGRRLSYLKENDVGALLKMAESNPEKMEQGSTPWRDTVVYQDFGGRSVIIMKAVRDESTGEMVASDVIDAAVVTARFRNVAERHGKVDLQFQIVVPHQMQASPWQVRFTPDMFILGDSIRLDPVVITGEGYRRAQLRGYEQYQRFLSKIVTDTSRFVNMELLDLFIQRNIPQIYAFKGDTGIVSDEFFQSFYGVTEQAAVEHYTDKVAKWRNDRRKMLKDRMFAKYVKAPIVTSGLRLDTVIHNFDGDFVYNYTQTINVRPGLRKASIVLSGGIYEQQRNIYTIPSGEPLTFYISSVSSLIDEGERYRKKIIGRRISANSSYDITFASGRSEIDLKMGDNRFEMERVERNLLDLMADTVYDLDSIVVCSYCSPEGPYRFNERLSKLRSESIAGYLRRFMKIYRDSIMRERGFSIDMDGNATVAELPQISFIARSEGEDWKRLGTFVMADTLLDDKARETYATLVRIGDCDLRERKMSAESFYDYVRDKYYPRLRDVRLNFHLHRKGMVSDTLVTTEIDTVYMRGLQAIKDMDYNEAASLLIPYGDYNAAIACICLDRNLSAMEILENLPESAKVLYMKAIVYSRLGDAGRAAGNYMEACRREPSFVHRGNLDPEIYPLVRSYNLNAEF